MKRKLIKRNKAFLSSRLPNHSGEPLVFQPMYTMVKKKPKWKLSFRQHWCWVPDMSELMTLLAELEQEQND
jgi:hypothetical protein